MTIEEKEQAVAQAWANLQLAKAADDSARAQILVDQIAADQKKALYLAAQSSADAAKAVFATATEQVRLDKVAQNDTNNALYGATEGYRGAQAAPVQVMT